MPPDQRHMSQLTSLLPPNHIFSDVLSLPCTSHWSSSKWLCQTQQQWRRMFRRRQDTQALPQPCTTPRCAYSESSLGCRTHTHTQNIKVCLKKYFGGIGLDVGYEYIEGFVSVLSPVISHSIVVVFVVGGLDFVQLPFQQHGVYTGCQRHHPSTVAPHVHVHVWRLCKIHLHGEITMTSTLLTSRL